MVCTENVCIVGILEFMMITITAAAAVQVEEYSTLRQHLEKPTAAFEGT